MASLISFPGGVNGNEPSFGQITTTIINAALYQSSLCSVNFCNFTFRNVSLRQLVISSRSSHLPNRYYSQDYHRFHELESYFGGRLYRCQDGERLSHDRGQSKIAN